MKTQALNKYYKTAVILTAAVSLAMAAAVIALSPFSIPSISNILTFAQNVIILAAMTVLFQKTVGFGQNKYKSIPIMLLPLELFIFIRGVIQPLVEIIPLSGENTVVSAIQFAIATAAALAVCLTVCTKWFGRYVAVFEEKSALIFPAEYRLNSKWWFVIAGVLVGGFVTSIISTIGNFTTVPIINSVVSALNACVMMAVYTLFFNIALKKIDKETRRLFVPNIFLTFLSSVIISVSDFITAFVPKVSISDAISLLKETGISTEFIFSIVPAIIYTLVFAVIEIVIVCYLCKKNFEAYEEKSFKS